LTPFRITVLLINDRCRFAFSICFAGSIATNNPIAGIPRKHKSPNTAITTKPHFGLPSILTLPPFKSLMFLYMVTSNESTNIDIPTIEIEPMVDTTGFLSIFKTRTITSKIATRDASKAPNSNSLPKTDQAYPRIYSRLIIRAFKPRYSSCTKTNCEKRNSIAKTMPGIIKRTNPADRISISNTHSHQ